MDTLSKDQLIDYLRTVCKKTDEEVVVHFVKEKVQRLVPCSYESSTEVYRMLKEDGPSGFWLENGKKLQNLSVTEIYYLYHYLQKEEPDDSSIDSPDDNSSDSEDDSSITINLVDPVYDRFKKALEEDYELDKDVMESFYKIVKDANDVASLKTSLTDTYEICTCDLDELVKNIFEAYKSSSKP